MAITHEQILAVADQLAADGVSPTLANVRKVLGGGSFTTISESMAVWRANQQPASAPARDPAPAPLMAKLAELGGEVWAMAAELAAARLQAEREALAQAQQDAAAASQEAADLADQLAADLDKAQGEISRLSAALETSHAQQVALQAAVQEGAEAVRTADHRAGLAEAGRVELQRQNGQLTEFLQRAQAEAAQAGHAAAEFRAKHEAEGLRAAEAIRRADDAQHSADRARKEAENARIAEQAAQARLEAAAREIEALREQVKAERGAASQAIENAAVLQGRLAALAKPGRKAKVGPAT